MASLRSRRLIYCIVTTVGIIAVPSVYQWIRPPVSVSYETVNVEHGDIEETVSALGVLVPSQYVDIGAQVEGQLIKLLVEPGDLVKSGQLVAVIDPTQYAAQVAEDQAGIADLKAQVNAWEAKLNLATWVNLANQSLVRIQSASQQTARQSESDAKVAKATIVSLQAQIEKTQNALKYDQAQLDRTSIHSPISGVVASPTSLAYGTTWSKMDVAHLGQTLNNKQSAPILFRVVNIDRMMVRAQVSEADVAKLASGMKVYFTTLGQPDRRIEAVLSSIEVTPELINDAIFYDADFEVPNPDHQLLPQMSVQVSFVVAQARDARMVPLAALLSTQRQNGATVPRCSEQGGHRAADNNLDCVVLLINGSPQTRAVTVGVKNETKAQILSGIEATDKLVVAAVASKARGAGNGGGRHRGGG